MKSTRAILLASTALLAVTAFAPLAPAAEKVRATVVAQAAPPPAAAESDDQKRKRLQDRKDNAKPGAAKPGAAAPPQARPQQPPAAQAPAARPQPPAAQAKPPAAPAQAPAAQKPQTAPAPQRAQQRDENRDRKPPAAAEQKKPATPPAPTAQQPKPAAPPAPTAQQPKPASPPAPTAQQPKPASPPAPTAQQPKPAAPPAPAAQDRRAPPPASTAQPQPSPAAPAVQPPAAAAPAPAAPAVAGAPAQPRNANDFIRRDGQNAGRGMDDVRKERRESREGNRTVIREGDRTIVREGNRTIIRHNEADRFSVGARDVKVDRRGDNTISVVVRPNGFSIVSTTDDDGHLIRRVRRDRNGREVVIIDNSFAGARRGDWFVDLPPPVIRIPRDRYIVAARRASPAQIYTVFTAPPVQAIEHRYTLDQVRYSAPLRDRMPRVDLDINFETGSWQLSPDQVQLLGEIAQGLNRAIEANPKEVFLIEGHTDAVGSDEDNLSLSDRRAEAVAVALTEQFQVPPENLVTQGYGEEYLKVQTDAAEPANRYVAVRRITPLMAQAQTDGGGPRQ